MFTLPAAVVAYAALGAVVIAEVVEYAALVSNAMTGRTSTLLAEIAKARKHLVHKVCTTFSSLTDNFGFLATKETMYCYTKNAHQSNKQSSHACGNSVKAEFITHLLSTDQLTEEPLLYWLCPSHLQRSNNKVIYTNTT